MDTLYSFRRCPYAMRARMALLVSGARFEIREVRLRDKPADMLALSPGGTVPVAVPDSGGVIDQSLDIMRWTLARHDPEDWLGGDDVDLIATFDDRFKQHLDRYKYAGRYDADPFEHRDAGLTLLRTLEPRLTRFANLCRETRALADMAIFPFVRQFAGVEQAWFDAQPVPHVRAWLAGHVASPLFERAMMRLEPWSPGDAAVVWPT